MSHDALVSFAERRGINMKKLNYTEDLLRVIIVVQLSRQKSKLFIMN